MVRAAERRHTRHGPIERWSGRVAHEPTERVTHEEDRLRTGDVLHLFDCHWQVFVDVVGDALRAAASEVARPSVPAQIEVEDVEPLFGEVVREAP